MTESAVLSSRHIVRGVGRRNNPSASHRSCGVVAPIRQLCRPSRATPDRHQVMYTDSNVDPPKDFETVGDVMTKGVLTVFATTPVIQALQTVVDKRITGMPVVDESNKVVGVVSDFDLLALDRVSLQQKDNVFPPPGQSWQTFNEVRRLIEKVEGQNVEDVMTPDPMVVRSETSLDAAARILLESKIRRLPVVDKDGILIGLLTRRDVVVAALRARQEKSANHTS